MLLLYVFILVWAADSGAYFAGRALGKHKISTESFTCGKRGRGAFGGFD